MLIQCNSAGSPGRNFLIKTNPEPGSIARRDSAPSLSGYLDSRGQVQTQCVLASTFSLISGVLSSDGERITASNSVPWQRFSVSGNSAGIAGIFAVAVDGTIHWNSDDFTNGTARFGAFPNGVFYGVFGDSWPNNMTLATLLAVDGMFTATTRSEGALENRLTNPPR